MAPEFNQGYALLIAVDENNLPKAALPDVAKDVAAVRDVLVHPDRCGYAADNVRMISGPASTRDGILDGLSWLGDKLANDTTGNSTAVIYYTGHGHQDSGDFYFIPYDVRLERIKTSAISARDFAADVAALKPKRLLVLLDCCHAAGMDVKDLDEVFTTFRSSAIPTTFFTQGEKPISAEAGAKGLETLQLGTGRAILSSCQAEEKSYLRKDRKMSIFTYHVIEALTGHAQPQTGATEVLVSDVMSHVWRLVPKSAKADWSRQQNPQYEVSGNFPVALLLGGKGLTEGQPPPDPLSMPSPPRSGTTYNATVTGDGAIAQGRGAQAVGKGGVIIGGSNTGNINTGTQINSGRGKRRS